MKEGGAVLELDSAKNSGLVSTYEYVFCLLMA
jgi:hypothetical protein